MTQQKRVAIYARFSSDLQRDASIEDQLASCKEHAAREGWTIVREYSDRAVSGASMFRPGIEALSRDAQAGRFDIVLSEAMDRLSRNLGDNAKFHQRLEFHGILLWTLTENQVDKMTIAMKGMMNETFLRDVALKTRRGQKGRIKAGKSAGGKSYGYKVLPLIEANGKLERGELEIDPAEAAVVVRIFKDDAQGIAPQAIAETLNLEGIPAPRGKNWSASTLHGNRERGTGLLNNPLYAGVRVWNRLNSAKDPDTGKRVSRQNPEEIVERIDVPHLRIVDEALWDAVRTRQGALKSKGTDVPIWDRRRPKFLLSYLLKCGCCGSGFSKVGQDGLAKTPTDYEAVYDKGPLTGDLMWKPWITDFERATQLRPEAWEATVESSDEEIASSIPMLLALHDIAEGGSELGEDAIRELDAMAPDMIPDLVANLNAWVKAQGRAQGPANLPGAPAGRAKVGRNDPCPCGSGREFKKCCGAEPIH